MECLEGTTLRFVDKNTGSPNTPKTCENGFSLLQVNYQSSYGLINARMQCVGGGSSDSNT